MMTLEKLKAIKNGDVIASGETENSPKGIYMTYSNIGRKLLWVAKKGHGYDDWCIYCDWADKANIDYVIKYGQKVTTETNIKFLIPCSDEVFKKYRY